MKNKLIGIAPIAAIVFTALSLIGLSLAACDSGSTSGGTPDLSGTITISPTTAATGTELTATYSGTEAVTYQWKNGAANVGANSNKHTPAESGSYTVTVSAAGYNSKTSAAVTVTGDDLPDLSGTVTISPNTGVTTGTELTANYSGSEAVTYQWKKDGTNVGTNNNKYTPAEAGSYTVTAIADGSKEKTSAAVTVTAAALQNLTGTITISPTAATTNTQLTANYSGSESVTYQWKNGTANVGTNSNKYTPTTAGSYTVTVSASGYNSKTSAPVTVTSGGGSGTLTIQITNLTPSANYRVVIYAVGGNVGYVMGDGQYTTADASGTVTCTDSRWEINHTFGDVELEIQYVEYASGNPTKTSKSKYKLDDMPATFHGVNDFN